MEVRRFLYETGGQKTEDMNCSRSLEVRRLTFNQNDAGSIPVGGIEYDNGMNYKPFDRKLCAENDMKAKRVAVDFLGQFGFHHRAGEEAFHKWDLILEKDGKEIPVEVERKRVWTKTAEWQGWPTIDVPVRKRDSKAEWFIMVNHDCDTLCFAKMEHVLTSPVGTKNTKVPQSGGVVLTESEPFFRAGLNIFRFFSLVFDQWIEITPDGDRLGF